MTPNETLVATAAAKFADLEIALNTIPALVAEVQNAVFMAHEAGIGRGGEFLRIKAMLSHADGRAAAALERVIAAHEKATAIAKRERCDAVLPSEFAIQPRSGGDR